MTLEKNLIYDNADIDVQIYNHTDYDIISNIAEQKTKYCEKPTLTCPISKSYNSLLYDKEEEYLMNRDVPNNTKQTAVDDLFDDLDKKWKNAKLKAKGGKKK